MTDERLEELRRRLAGAEEEDRRRAIADVPEGWSPGALGLLLEAMGDASWRVRKDAVSRVARWPDPDGAVPLLISTLADDTNVGLRNAAVEALTAIGRPAVGTLATALSAGGPHRKFLVDALGAIGHPAALPALLGALEDADENVRAAAAEGLGRIGGAQAIAALRRSLGASGLLLRLAALEALNHLRAALPIGEVEALLDEPVLRRAALEALGHAGDPAALPRLLDGLEDRSRGVREAAAVALVSLHAAQGPAEGRAAIERAVRGHAAASGIACLPGGASAPPSLVRGLLSSVGAEAVTVRRAAVALLGWGRWPDALPRLVEALADDELYDEVVDAITAYGPPATVTLVEIAGEAGPDLRAAIFGLIPRLKPEVGEVAARDRLEALLLSALEDDDPDAAAAAARALGETAGRDALPALFQALESAGDPTVAAAVAQALARLGARWPEQVRILIASHGLRGPAGALLCRVLGSVGTDADRPLVLGALRSDEPALRRAAAESLARIGPAPETRSALLLTLADEDGPVRAAAAEALGALGEGDADAVPALIRAAADDDEELVRLAAVKALAALRDPRAAPLLRNLARASDGALAVHALEALGRLRCAARGDLELLLGALDRRDTEVVKAAVRALAGCAGEAAREGLERALGHRRWDVRRLAVQGLAGRASEDPRALDALRERAAVEDDPLVRDALEATVRGAGRG